jgi:uncharacterized damage-inducible protein DinB
MKAFFKELLEYSYRMNERIIDTCLRDPDKTSEKSIKLINHVLNAQQIWNNRISKNEESVGVWSMRDLSALKKMNASNYERSCAIVDNKDLQELISYTNTKGDTFKNSVKDILFHAINHSTYHRAQIATEFKGAGVEPPVTDYIFYKR